MADSIFAGDAVELTAAWRQHVYPDMMLPDGVFEKLGVDRYEWGNSLLMYGPPMQGVVVSQASGEHTGNVYYAVRFTISNFWYPGCRVAPTDSRFLILGAEAIRVAHPQ